MIFRLLVTSESSRLKFVNNILAVILPKIHYTRFRVTSPTIQGSFQLVADLLLRGSYGENGVMDFSLQS